MFRIFYFVTKVKVSLSLLSSLITMSILIKTICLPYFVNFFQKIFDNSVIIGRIFSKGDGINA